MFTIRFSDISKYFCSDGLKSLFILLTWMMQSLLVKFIFFLLIEFFNFGNPRKRCCFPKLLFGCKLVNAKLFLDKVLLLFLHTRIQIHKSSMRFHAWNHMVPYNKFMPFPCMESHGIIWFHAWNRMESYGSMHGIVWNHMVPSMESHGII